MSETSGLWELGKWIFTHALTAAGSLWGGHRISRRQSERQTESNSDRLSALEISHAKEKARVTEALDGIAKQMLAESAARHAMHKDTAERFNQRFSELRSDFDSLRREFFSSGQETVNRIIQVIREGR